MDDDIAAIVYPLLLALAGFALVLGLSWWVTEPHRRELREHGCQLIHESETGRITGKGHHELVRVYECADGMRTELD
jgi:hypothetical protein